MNNLTTLIKRLEAATSRLEDIASSVISPEQTLRDLSSPSAAAPLTTSGSAPNLTTSTATVPEPAPAAPPTPSLPQSITALDTLLSTHLPPFLTATASLSGSPIPSQQAESVRAAFLAQRRFILTSTRARKPDFTRSETFSDLLADLQHAVDRVNSFRDNRAERRDHLAMVAEGIGALQWLLVDTKPADFVGETLGGAMLFGNRVLTACKNGGGEGAEAVKAFEGLLKALKEYVQTYYPAGLTWNAQGVEDAAQAYREAGEGPTEATTAAANGTVAAAPPPPPPPPPPPLPNFDNSGAPTPPPAAPKNAARGSGGGDMGAVFEQLNRGAAVTAGLRKVDASEMTHKNPSLRASSIVPENQQRAKSPGPGPAKPKPETLRQNSTGTSTNSKLPPNNNSNKPASTGGKTTLDGNKYIIENYDRPPKPIEITITSLAQSVLITKCAHTTIIVRGKANAVSIDSSPRAQVLVETLVSGFEIMRSPGVAVQITGHVPTVVLDQVDGGMVYLPAQEEGKETEVFTSKCSGVNVVVPEAGGEEAEGKEWAIPEQIRSVVRGGKVRSEIVEHAG